MRMCRLEKRPTISSPIFRSWVQERLNSLGFADLVNRSANRCAIGQLYRAVSCRWLLSIRAGNFQFLLCAHRHAVCQLLFLRDGNPDVATSRAAHPLDRKTFAQCCSTGCSSVVSGNIKGSFIVAILKARWRVDHGPDRGAGALLLGILMGGFSLIPRLAQGSSGADVALPDAHRVLHTSINPVCVRVLHLSDGR
jgi:hypothetical protein